ncbi:MAG: glycosyltransferase family 4 protein [Bacteroidota bacterium]|jgi:glycosyltransferase involved in cell wall biosynthesis
MKILILTQYFPPEIGAPQNRLYELAVRLKKFGHEITILTAMPNYPKMEIHNGYKGRWSMIENMNGLEIHRTSIFVTKSKGILNRLMNYYSFVLSSLFYGLFNIGSQDVVFVESPPLFLGKTGWLLSIMKGSKMIFNVSDLWPESAEKLGLVKNKFFLKIAYQLEHFLYEQSWLITGQTQGIVKDIGKRFPKKIVYWLPNGVDLNFFKVDYYDGLSFRSKMGFSETDFLILYAGVIGHAQGLEVILNAAELLKDKRNIKFVLLGSGPEKDNLIELKTQKNLEFIYFLDPVSKIEMPEIVAACNVSVIPLKKLDLFKGAIPSKIFENLAMKKPILLGVEGEAKELFIDEANSGFFFEPENEKDLAIQILAMEKDPDLCVKLGENGNKFVAQKFERDLIAERFNVFLQENYINAE